MAATQRLDYNADADVWEVASYLNSGAATINFQVANVRPGAGDAHELYQEASDGQIYHAETGSTDNAVAITATFLTKKIPLPAVCLIQEVFLRLAAVTDAAVLTVRCGGSEYGDVSQDYDLSYAGSGDLEIKVRTHRFLKGRWVSLEISGSFVNRPAVRELSVRFIPIRSGKVSS